MRIFALFALLLVPLLAFSSGKQRPKFSAYPVDHIYEGTPVQPILNAEQRRFRTMIRRGANRKVEYAGHYTIPRFGYGAECNAFYIVDSISGRVFDGFGVTELPGLWLETRSAPDIPRMEFHPNSPLLKINGCLNEKDCGFYDYVMVDGSGLKLVYKELLPKKFQP